MRINAEDSELVAALRQIYAQSDPSVSEAAALCEALRQKEAHLRALGELQLLERDTLELNELESEARQVIVGGEHEGAAAAVAAAAATRDAVMGLASEGDEEEMGHSTRSLEAELQSAVELAERYKVRAAISEARKVQLQIAVRERRAIVEVQRRALEAVFDVFATAPPPSEAAAYEGHHKEDEGDSGVVHL